MNLKGKVAVVTGAGGGIGSEIVKRLKSEGVKIILIEREKTLLENIVDIVDGDSSSTFECDFAAPDALKKLGDEISVRFPQIDLLFNIAGIGVYKNIEDLEIGEWEKSLAINLTAPFILIKKLLPSLKNSEEAVVINIGSGTGVMPKAGRVAYCSSKFGLRGMSLTLAEEFKEKNVDFVLMTLGSVMTNFGTGGILHRKELEKGGKKYLDSADVAQKIIEIVKSEDRNAEYEIYPEGYENENKQSLAD